MSRPLGSTLITRASSLLRAGPPACSAMVLNVSQFLLLDALPVINGTTATGDRIGTHLPTFRAEAADQARVASMPDTVWPVAGLPPDSSRFQKEARFRCHLIRFDTSSAIHSRSPS
jgi:hypothetical protein